MALPYTQHFFAEGRYLGSALRGTQLVHGEFQKPPSYIFICHACGETYGKAIFEGKTYCQPIVGACRRHNSLSIFRDPGSLWLSWDLDFINSFPEQAIYHELTCYHPRTADTDE